MPVGSSPALHVHHALDDTWYILDGKMVVHCGDDVMVVGAGHWVSMPRGVPHTFRVVGSREARILLVHDNASFRDLIRELGVPPIAHCAGTASLPVEGRACTVAASHDLTPVGPPMVSKRPTRLGGRSLNHGLSSKRQVAPPFLTHQSSGIRTSEPWRCTADWLQLRFSQPVSATLCRRG